MLGTIYLISIGVYCFTIALSYFIRLRRAGIISKKYFVGSFLLSVLLAPISLLIFLLDLFLKLPFMFKNRNVKVVDLEVDDPNADD